MWPSAYTQLHKRYEFSVYAPVNVASSRMGNHLGFSVTKSLQHTHKGF